MPGLLDTLQGGTALVVGGGEGLPAVLAARFQRVIVADANRTLTSPPHRHTLGEGEIVYVSGQDADPEQLRGGLSLVVLAFTIGRRDNVESWLTPWISLLGHQGRLVLLEWHSSPKPSDADTATHQQLLATLEKAGRLRRPGSRALVHLLQSVGLVHVRQETADHPAWFTSSDCAMLAADGLRELTSLGDADSPLATQLRSKQPLLPGPVILVHGVYKQLPDPVVDDEPPSTVEESAESNNGSTPNALIEPEGTLPDLLTAVLRGHTRQPRQAAQRLLTAFGTRALSQLRDATVIADEAGLDLDAALHLVAVLRLGQRLHEPMRDIEIHGPEDAWHYLAAEMSPLTREHFRGLYLNVKGRIVVDEVISIGTLTSALVHPREVFGPAIEKACHSVLIAHNHPSGDPTPSMEDIHLTRELADAGRLLNIELLDHIVIGRDSYVSLKEKRHF